MSALQGLPHFALEPAPIGSGSLQGEKEHASLRKEIEHGLDVADALERGEQSRRGCAKLDISNEQSATGPFTVDALRDDMVEIFTSLDPDSYSQGRAKGEAGQRGEWDLRSTRRGQYRSWSLGWTRPRPTACAPKREAASRRSRARTTEAKRRALSQQDDAGQQDRVQARCRHGLCA